MKKIVNPLFIKYIGGSYMVIKGGGHHTHMLKYYKSACHLVNHPKNTDSQHLGFRVVLKLTCKK